MAFTSQTTLAEMLTYFSLNLEEMVNADLFLDEGVKPTVYSEEVVKAIHTHLFNDLSFEEPLYDNFHTEKFTIRELMRLIETAEYLQDIVCENQIKNYEGLLQHFIREGVRLSNSLRNLFRILPPQE